MKQIRIFSSVLMGFTMPFGSLLEGLDVDVIAMQGTSMDPGPLSLGRDKPRYSRIGVKRQLEQLLKVGKENNIPIIASTGGAGADVHVEWTLKIIDEIAKEKNLKLKIAAISGEIDKDYLKVRLARGDKMKRFWDTSLLSEYLTAGDVDRSVRIVSQMGPEPIMKALDLDVDAVITGRALDSALHMAMPLKKGFDKGLAAHMGEILECGKAAVVGRIPGQGNATIGTIKEDHLLLEPLDPRTRCTVESVTHKILHERDHPLIIGFPGGRLDLTDSKYEQVDERTVRAYGGKWVPTEYKVRLEGIASIGYQAISMGGIRDPVAIANIEQTLNGVREWAEKSIPEKEYDLVFHVYGKNGVMGEWEPQKEITSHELFILINVIAKTQELAEYICTFVSTNLHHYRAAGTSSNSVAFPFCPTTIPLGENYMFNIWHLMPLKDPCEPYRTHVLDFPRT